MFLSLPILGAYFCSICPLAFVGRKLKRFGPGFKYPKILRNRFISLSIVLLVYWGLFYAFPTLFSRPIVVALFYTFFTILAFTFYFLFGDMSYCRYICPISAIRNAYSKDAFMWLGTYESVCKTCTRFECAKACEFHQTPFLFNKNNSMGDCTLCMDCANACAAVGYSFHMPGFSLLKPIRKKCFVDVWSYVLLFAFMTLTIKFMLYLNHTAAESWLPWMWLAHGLQNLFPSTDVNIEALSTLLFSLIITMTLLWIGFKKASEALGITMKTLFLDVGYAYAPLPLIGSLSFACTFFFTRYFHHVINGFIQAFHLPIAYIKPLATPDASWLHYFHIFDWIAVGWTILLIVRRIEIVAPNVPRKYKNEAAFWLSLLPIFYLFA